MQLDDFYQKQPHTCVQYPTHHYNLFTFCTNQHRPRTHTRFSTVFLFHFTHNARTQYNQLVLDCSHTHTICLQIASHIYTSRPSHSFLMNTKCMYKTKYLHSNKTYTYQRKKNQIPKVYNLIDSNERDEIANHFALLCKIMLIIIKKINKNSAENSFYSYPHLHTHL